MSVRLHLIFLATYCYCTPISSPSCTNLVYFPVLGIKPSSPRRATGTFGFVEYISTDSTSKTKHLGVAAFEQISYCLYLSNGEEQTSPEDTCVPLPVQATASISSQSPSINKIDTRPRLFEFGIRHLHGVLSLSIASHHEYGNQNQSSEAN
jgi:hypothetical protein